MKLRTCVGWREMYNLAALCLNIRPLPGFHPAWIKKTDLESGLSCNNRPFGRKVPAALHQETANVCLSSAAAAALLNISEASTAFIWSESAQLGVLHPGKASFSATINKLSA